MSLNIIETIRNEYTELLDQFPELTRRTTKGENVKHGITHKIVTKGHTVFARPRNQISVEPSNIHETAVPSLLASLTLLGLRSG